MKVKELIKLLENEPQNHEVVFRTLQQDYGFWPDKPLKERVRLDGQHFIDSVIFCSEEHDVP